MSMDMPALRPMLGDRARCILTKFEGIVVQRIESIGGGITFILQSQEHPPHQVQSDGNFLEVLEVGAVKPFNLYPRRENT